MISVIIPAYNASKTIALCIDSIFQQDYKDFEVIVMNDGSSDDTTDKIRKFAAKWPADVKLINQENRGSNAARNRGAQEAHGEYIIFCDADIVMRRDCLEQMKHALETNPNASYVYSTFRFGWKKFKLWPFDPVRLRQMPYIHTTSLIRREHFSGFDETVKRLQDWDLWLTMLEQGHTGIWVPELLFQVINTKGTMSQWIPSFFYKLPWHWFGIRYGPVERYNEAVEHMKAKHHLL